MCPVQTALLTSLEPVAALSSGRLQELASMCLVEQVSQGLNPLRMNVVGGAQLLYLLQGDLKLVFPGGKSVILKGGSGAARHPVASGDLPLQEAVALSDLQILRIDADLLDIMLTWDQLTTYEKNHPEDGQAGEWMKQTGVFSAESLKNGIFKALPPANVEEMFNRMARIPASAGQEIIRQGEEGDYYYLIESGEAEVTRSNGEGFDITLAQLAAGSAFGEEALISGNKRNATVTMKTDGTLLRLDKQDFNELLKKPLLNEISPQEAERKIEQGAILLDVRTPAEFDFKHQPGAINVPLFDIREAMKALDKSRPYITVCQTGRRAAAAAFILAQQGFEMSAMKVTE